MKLKEDDKKIPWGVIVISILFFILAVIGAFFMFAISAFSRSWSGASASLVDYLVSVLPLLLVLPGIFLLKGKNWARVMALVISGLLIIFSVYSVISGIVKGYSFVLLFLI